MFSRFYDSTRTFFSRSPSFTRSTEQHHETPAGQAQAELQDPLHTMVTTRRQEHESNETTLVDGLETNSPRLSTKRKAGNQTEDSPQPVEKRARVESPLTTAHELPTTDDNVAVKVDGEVTLSQDDTQMLAIRPHGILPAKQGDIGDIESQVAESVELPMPTAEKEAEGSTEQHSEADLYPTLQSQTEEIKEPTKHQSDEGDVPTAETTGVRKPKHIRFGSEDLTVRAQQSSSTSVQYQDLNYASKANGESDQREAVDEADEEDSEAEDEAPDTITTSTGQAQALQSAAGAEKAIRGQLEAQKNKRRKRDTELKAQARVAKRDRPKKQRPGNSKSSANKQAQGTGETLAQQLLKAGRLPNELPAEILADDGEVHMPLPPPESIASKPTAQNKRKLLDTNTKPPKDVKRGNKIVRVLQSTSAVLPPKVSKSSMSIREAWLRGRKGTTDKRKATSRGFIRK